MPLSPSEKNLLVDAYDDLQNFLTPDKQELWVSNKEEIIAFCVENEIFLYNIVSLKQSNASELLNQLVDHFSLPLELLAENEREQLTNLRLLWKNKFDETLKTEQDVLAKLHNDAYLSVIDQYQKTKAVLPETLLTFKDMVDLLALTMPPTQGVISFEPFSLTEHSVEQNEKLVAWIHSNSSQYDHLFVPVNHDGHWFYLLYQEGVWTIKDSQPLLQDGTYSPRQQSIIENCNRFLNTASEIKFESSGEQNNDYDCGSRVINAYRALVNPNYLAKSHKEILRELFQYQSHDEISTSVGGENIFLQQENDENLDDVESISSDGEDEQFFDPEENYPSSETDSDSSDDEDKFVDARDRLTSPQIEPEIPSTHLAEPEDSIITKKSLNKEALNEAPKAQTEIVETRVTNNSGIPLRPKYLLVDLDSLLFYSPNVGYEWSKPPKDSDLDLDRGDENVCRTLYNGKEIIRWLNAKIAEEQYEIIAYSNNHDILDSFENLQIACQREGIPFYSPSYFLSIHEQTINRPQKHIGLTTINGISIPIRKYRDNNIWRYPLSCSTLKELLSLDQTATLDTFITQGPDCYYVKHENLDDVSVLSKKESGTPVNVDDERLASINIKLKSIDDILVRLKEKISKINYHHADAKTLANELLENLQKYRDAYGDSLRKNETSDQDAVAEGLFKSSCKEVIEKASPVLSKDLGWGEYLQNLFRELVNTGVKKISFGKYQGTLFNVTLPESFAAAEEARVALLNPSAPPVA